jgi:hypothetical protein
MKPEAQRIAIAEACGYANVRQLIIRNVTGPGDDRTCGITSDRGWIHDYLNDLNAMRDAEKLIFDSYDRSQWFQYVTHLQTACFCAGNETHMDHIHATAAQRAEAFLKTLGLWT